MKSNVKGFLKKVSIGLISVLFVLPALAGCNQNSGENNVIKLKDNNEILTNPDMGFNFTYYANTIYDFNYALKAGDYLDEFPCDTVFFRIGWNYIEPEEGKFDWDFTDRIADEWKARGKNIAFCWAVSYPGDQSTPLWVKEAGAQGVEYMYVPEENEDGTVDYYFRNKLPDGTAGTGGMTFRNLPRDAQDFVLNRNDRLDPNYNGGNPVEEGDYEHYRGSWIVNYDDPVFLAKWENFLKAAAERYDSDPAVQFVEIGSFGDWGEGHPSYTHGNPISEATKRTHIDLYLKYFKNVQIMVNDDAIKNTDLAPYTRQNGIGLSDHSVQVPMPNAGEEGAYGNVDLAKLYYRERPILLEHHNGTTFKETYYNSIIDCHATYARINCDPYFAAASEWKDKIARKLGYRLVFSEVEFSPLVAGTETEFRFTMTNEGSAPCYGGGNPTFYLVDSLGRIKATAVSDFDVKNLKVGERDKQAEAMSGTAVMKLPENLIADDYYICISVTKDGKDYYKLPLNHRDGTRLRYRIATFQVQK